MNFKIGSDPELFLVDAQGKFISAVGLIGGTKYEPLPISMVGHAIQEDNVSVEFNIPPADDCKEFIANIDFVLSHLQHKVNAIGLKFSQKAAVSFDEDQLQTLEAQTFGCEPDYNAWTLQPNPKPTTDDPNLRSCGGHIHVGTDLDRVQVVRAMDMFLGVPSVLLDEDNVRRKLYGKAGAHRPKEYGVEYRTLSNFWIWSTKTKEWVYEQTRKALEFVANEHILKDQDGDFIQHIINTGDKDGALQFCQLNPSL